MTPARWEEIAAALPNVRLVVLGDVMLDRYVSGSVDRISPEAPVPVVRVQKQWDALGGAANVAANVLSLGARCDVVGVVGEDDVGRTVERILAEMGGGCRLVRDQHRETTVKTRILAHGQQVVRFDRERTAPIRPATEIALRGHLGERLPGAHGLVLADYDKGTLAPTLIRAAIEAATDLGVPVIADPKRRNFFSFAGATVLKPNRAELETALGEAARPREDAWMEAARSRTRAKHLLVTLGADGMALASPGPAVRRVRAHDCAVYDASGAGDTVAAVVAASLATEAAVEEAAEIASAAAAVCVAKVGVATVTRDEVAAVLAAE